VARRREEGAAAARERVEHPVAVVGQHLHEPPRQADRERRGVAGRLVVPRELWQAVGRVGPTLGDVLAGLTAGALGGTTSVSQSNTLYPPGPS
jgi:hypothetical protein